MDMSTEHNVNVKEATHRFETFTEIGFKKIGIPFKERQNKALEGCSRIYRCLRDY